MKKKPRPIPVPGSMVLYPKKRPRKRRLYMVKALLGDWSFLFENGECRMDRRRWRWVKVQHLRVIMYPTDDGCVDLSSGRQDVCPN
ncbi:hypothetical protein WME76_01305 [Sorangium sp. So ce119]|uniref:hypothetical protein n=1 Tax=Sorangium sp. So ce119 TaxID=3133279 RepID=UPI003F5DC804